MAKKKTAKKKTTPKATSSIRGKKFCIAGSVEFGGKAALEKLIRAKGGKVAAAVSGAVDFLVQGNMGGGATAQKKAEKLNASGKANIVIIDELALHQMFAPTREASLKTLARGVTTWNKWMEPAWLQFTVDLSEADFRKRKFVFAKFTKANVTGCDFRRANLAHAEFGVVHNAIFDGCEMTKKLGGLINCSARRIQGVTVFRHLDLSGTDFTGGNMWAGAYATALKCTFDKARFDAFWEYANFTGSSFVEAKFTEARMYGCDFTDCDLTGARFHKTDLTGANFQNANLAGADFKGAILNDANFSKAKITDANFNEANVRGVTFTPSQIKSAKGLTKDNLKGGKAGKYVKELQEVAKNCDMLQISIRVDLERHDYVVVNVTAYSDQTASGETQHYKAYGSFRHRHHDFPSESVSQSLVGLANRWVDKGTVRLDQIEVSVQGSSIKADELNFLAKRAWCEAFGLPVPTDADLKKQQNKEAQGAIELREAALADFQNGAKGVKAWNNRKPADREVIGSLKGLDFSNLKLKKINFDKANLSKANFAGANLQEAYFYAANLKDVDFTGVDLSGGRFFRADIRGANFTGAKLTKTDFDKAKFDEKTTFPKSFYYTQDMKWVGKKGVDPRVAAEVEKLKIEGPINFDTFIEQLRTNFDAKRLKNALKMLKADRFELFSEVHDDSFVGIVKSQTDAKLVYSCRLNSAGEFSCCTQNLNTCGGLRGALCKHLLVLIVGLTKAGELDPTTLNQWVVDSKLHKPTLDKDAMSEIFLKYKGAEAGEIDWRPTETVPEDYYAF